MLRSKLFAGVLLAFTAALLGFRDARSRPEPPALVVVVSVDQLRADLLERYDRLFTGGLRRLMDEGMAYTAVHDHALSETAPGHATLATGVVPARSGIVSNHWWERVGDRWVEVYNVEDTLSPVLGHPEEEGRSPRNLLRPGIADWIQGAGPDARVVSIGGKDRSAILLAGKARGQVLWFDHDVGRFVTSAHYADRYPEWVQRFNDRELPLILDSVWTSQVPASARSLARPDTSTREADGLATSAFPHRFDAEKEGKDFGGIFSKWVGRTPFVDEAALALAELALTEANLGQDAVTDYLALGLAQADYIGHRYGPLSQEQLDNLLRLDRELGEFFRALDREVGEGRWVLALSADHGVVDFPEWRVAHGEPGYRVTPAERERMFAAAERAREAAQNGDASRLVEAALEEFPFVADALTLEEIARGEPQDSFVALYQRSYRPGRVPGDFGPYGVVIRPTEGTYVGWKDSTTGTSHGTPYLYDREVPLIFLGSGVQPGRAVERVRTVDLAPTLARVAGVPVPDDLDGRTLPLGPRE